MGRVKISRHHISLDMTAMCDMAFLLLTFFMLTTKFKPQEDIELITPSSVTVKKVPEKSLMLISIDQKGKVHLGIAEDIRVNLISSIETEYTLNLTEKDKQIFSSISSIGTSISMLPKLFKSSDSEKSKWNNGGIPCDSAKNELSVWIRHARKLNPSIKFAIRGDRELNFEIIDRIVSTLQEQNINKFNLVTSMKIQQN